MASPDPITAPPTVELRPRASAVGAWSFLAVCLVAAGVFFVIDSGGHLASWALLAVSTVVAIYFVAQSVPGVVTVRLDQQRLRARTFWRSTEISWDDVRLARVRHVAGEPVLALDIREESVEEGAPPRHYVVGVLLPLGADLEPLHDFLETRLGRSRRISPPPGFTPRHL